MLLLFLLASATLIAGEEHEIVYPMMIVARSGERRLLFKAFDQDFHLRLEPTDVLADDFVLMTKDEKGNERSLKLDIEHWRNRVLQDPNVGSTVDVEDKAGRLQINGVINERLRIEPALDLTDESADESVTNGESVNGRQRFSKTFPHRVIRLEPRTNAGGYFDEIVPPGVKPVDTNVTKAEWRQSVAPVRVELAIVTDQLHSKKLGSDEKTIVYLIILLNSVNWKYQTMGNIMVSFKLVAARRNLSSRDEPYIANNMYDGHALSGPTISGFAQYCVSNNIFPTADVVHLITAQKLGDKEEGSNKANPGVIGIAYVGGVCDKNYKFGVSEDGGSRFDGCLTVAHELCHSCGCPHDGDAAPSYIPGSPGASACPWNDGYIMSYIAEDEKQFCFSKCSENCVAHMIKIASCMTTENVKSTINVNDNRLPGQYVSDQLGLQDLKYYQQRCKDFRQDLELLQEPRGNCFCRCKTPTVNWTYYYYDIAAIDGEKCATGKYCLNGICK